jgi:hypothetical protein
MNSTTKLIGRWSTVAVFAVAMAWVEAAVVFYLRTLVDRIQPYQPDPLPVSGSIGFAELVRELSTLVMLITVGTLAGRTWQGRLGFAAVAFGIWDIFYYVFLNVLTGWPRSILDWDILFLIPLPWWGPVIAPVSIAFLMISWGTLAALGEERTPGVKTTPTAWAIGLIGIFVALYVFMQDTMKVASQGEAAVRKVLPEQFDWLTFSVALGLMAYPVLQLGLGLGTSNRKGQPLRGELTLIT